MYALQNAQGDLVLSTRTGEPLTYSEWKYADYAARALRKQHGVLKVVRV